MDVIQIMPGSKSEQALEIVGPNMEIICGAQFHPSHDRQTETVWFRCPPELAFELVSPTM